MKNYYKTLGINQDSSNEEIKKAFRELAFKYHPDKNTDHASAEKFKEINEAKQVLLDDLKKFRYDEMLLDFLSRNKAGGKAKDLKRKRFRYRSLYLQLIKETLLNKFFLGILFVVTVLTTIAFYKIPDEETSLAAPLIANSSTSVHTEPAAIPETMASYSSKNNVQKEAVSFKVEKKAAKVKTAFHRSYFSKKAAKKLNFNTQIKKARHIAAGGSHKPRKHTVISPAIATGKVTSEKVFGKQLTTENMSEILQRIKTEKQKAGNSSNCVQIVKSETSNISNVFMLANFLKGYGYVISGREKIPETVNGVIISVVDQCITVSVGTL